MDAWYQTMAERYGEEFCRIAGYFDETKPFTVPYGSVFNLPENKLVIQFSGAFFPFHEGHLETVKNTVLYILDHHYADIVIIIHADHSEYRHSKGTYSEENFLNSFSMLNDFCKIVSDSKSHVEWQLISEDSMPDGCSRNFTRLYSELMEKNLDVIFLSGGDRANFALTFLDKGQCIISGRDKAENFKKYNYLQYNTVRITFLPGNIEVSSTLIRSQA
jgi:hypothetical protein